MEVPRRYFLHLAAGAVVLPTISRIARAQTYPTRPVRWIVGTVAGGPVDVFARLVGQRLSERLGRPFVIENRPGAGTNIATEAVVRAAPDGYTLLSVASSAAINATLYNTLNFNFIRDIAPVASLIRQPFIMLVNQSLAAKTVSEFIAFAKSNPGKVNMAVPGNGTGPHLAGELFKIVAGVDMLNVPYRGAVPALTGLLAGEVQILFGTAPEATGSIRAGKVRALAVTTKTRLEALPDVPTLGDFVPGYEVSGWNGVGAPKNTPVEIIDKLNMEMNGALADREMKARLASLGATAFAGTPADFGKFIAHETEKWAKVIKFAGIKLE